MSEMNLREMHPPYENCMMFSEPWHNLCIHVSAHASTIYFVQTSSFDISFRNYSIFIHLEWNNRNEESIFII